MTTTTNTNPARYVCPRRARITRALYPHRIAGLDTIRHELAQGLSDTSKTSVRRRVLVRIGDPQDTYIKSSHPETMRATAQYYDVWCFGVYDTDIHSGLPDSINAHNQAFLTQDIPRVMSLYHLLDTQSLAVTFHCHAGISRSAALLVGYLLYTHDISRVIDLYASRTYVPNPLLVGSILYTLSQCDKWREAYHTTLHTIGRDQHTKLFTHLFRLLDEKRETHALRYTRDSYMRLTPVV